MRLEELTEAEKPTKPRGGHYVKTIGGDLKKIHSVKGRMAYVDTGKTMRDPMPISYLKYVGFENGKHIWKDT